MSKIHDKYDIIRIFIYGNKLLIQDDLNKIELVICKNMSDCIRLYNELKNNLCNGIKNIIFNGTVENNTELKKRAIDLIKDKTSWSKKEIYRKSTRH